MKRTEFYKEYYKITNRPFSDRMIWSLTDRETAWRKGQHNVAKIERKLFIVLQYLILLCCWIPLFFGLNGWCCVFGVVLFILLSYITDFSIIKIEILYHIYNRNNIYSKLLYKIFSGKIDSFFNLIRTGTKKNISGFVLQNGQKLIAKYCAVFRKQRNKAILIFKPNCITVRYNSVDYKIDDTDLTESKLADRIAHILNA